MIQTGNSYDETLNMDVDDFADFFKYILEKNTGRAELTDMQRDMIKENKIEQEKK